MSRKKDKNSRSKLIKKKANIAKMKQQQLNSKTQIVEFPQYQPQQIQHEIKESFCAKLPYHISRAPVDDKKEVKLPKKIEQRKKYIFDHLIEQPEELLDELLQLTNDYPQVREFDNYLANCYKLLGNQKAHEDYTLRLFQRHPDYLFGRFQLGLIYVEQERFTELLELFGGKFDLQVLAPERNTFHISEAESFFYIAGHYFAWNDDVTELNHSIGVLNELEPESSMLRGLMSTVLIKRMEKFSNMLND